MMLFKVMNHKILIPLLLAFSVFTLKAQDISKRNFQQAYQEISSMLEGKQPLDFEKAVFLTENAYRDNSLNYEDFKSAIDIHSTIIEQFIKANDKYDWKQFVKGNMGIAPDMEVEAKERYRKALANYGIFTYLTDTLTVKLGGQEFLHLPYTYSSDDPFGTADWKNSQTINLLETQKGNCYSLVTLFKILSERFKSDANIGTAPQHIYIEHRDPKGSRFNVEVATRSFPDFGSIQTLTYTTREALLNDISMRKLDLKQSVGLCLVYLAKGYEYKNKIKDDDFILTCANTALQHDPKSLNALLLKAQVYEQRVMRKQMPSAPYEKMLAEFYKLGYRQMPDEMKEIILSKIQDRPSTVTPTNKTPNTFADIGEQSRTVTLSNGLFEEFHTHQKIVRYGQTIFDTDKGKIVKFLDEDISSYQVDPVVFALSVDPLTKSYPWYTPYQFAGNTPIQAIDLDGLEEYHYTLTLIDGNWNIDYSHLSETYGVDTKPGFFGFMSAGETIPNGESYYIINYSDSYWGNISWQADNKTWPQLFQKAKSGPGLLGANREMKREATLNSVNSFSNTMVTMPASSPSYYRKPATSAMKVSSARELLSTALKRQNLQSAPAKFKEKWSDNGYDYEVRIHPPQTNAPEGSNSASDITFRVARRLQGKDENGQGHGWEYADDSGNWYKESELKGGKNEKAANDTHIKLNN